MLTASPRSWLGSTAPFCPGKGTSADRPRGTRCPKSPWAGPVPICPVRSVHRDGDVERRRRPSHIQQRSVPFPAFLTDPLAAATAGKGSDDLVFTAPGGGDLRNTNFRSRVFDRAKKELGLPGLRVHDLRHTAASLAIAAGANVKAVQSMLGHASAAMTLDVCAGLFKDDMDVVAELLDAAVSQACADSLRTAEVLRLAQGTEPKGS